MVCGSISPLWPALHTGERDQRSASRATRRPAPSPLPFLGCGLSAMTFLRVALTSPHIDDAASAIVEAALVRGRRPVAVLRSSPVSAAGVVSQHRVAMPRAVTCARDRPPALRVTSHRQRHTGGNVAPNGISHRQLKRIRRGIYLEPERHAALRAPIGRTCVPMQVCLREGFERALIMVGHKP
jgi:hypothetical protein